MTKIEVQGADISDFVVSCGSIPLLVRNRDLSLVAEGFSFEVGMANVLINMPVNGNTVVVKKDNAPIFYGYVKGVRADYDKGTYQVDAENLLVKLEDRMLTNEEIGDFVEDCVSPDPWIECVFDGTSNTVYMDSHGFYNDEGVIFRTDGTMPTGLQAGRVYYVKRLDADHIQVKEYMGADTGVDFGTNGSGKMEYNYADVSIWNYRDNENAPNVTLNRLLEKIFEKGGMALDTSEVHEITLFQKTVDGVLTIYTLKTICIDEHMLYCLNIDRAMHYSKIDDPETDAGYSSSKLSLWEFVSLLCGVFDLVILPKDSGYGKFKLARITGSMSYSEDDTLSMTEEKVLKDGGGYTLFVRRSDIRVSYGSGIETDLEDREKTVVGGGKEKVEIISNLKLLLRDRRGGATPGAVLPSVVYFVNVSKVAFNRLQEFEKDRVEKEFSLREMTIGGNAIEVRFDAEREAYEVLTVDYV